MSDEKIDPESKPPKRNWVLSKKLIGMLDLKPAPKQDRMTVRGEDDKWYDIDTIVINLMDRLKNINLTR